MQHEFHVSAFYSLVLWFADILGIKHMGQMPFKQAYWEAIWDIFLLMIG